VKPEEHRRNIDFQPHSGDIDENTEKSFAILIILLTTYKVCYNKLFLFLVLSGNQTGGG